MIKQKVVPIVIISCPMNAKLMGMVVDFVVGMVVVIILELEVEFVDIKKRHLQLHSTRI